MRTIGSVLVTGGAGFIGTHLVRNLLRLESKVTVVDKVARPESLGTLGRLEYRRIDAYKINGSETQSLHKAKIVHLAAETSVERSVRQPLSSVKSNVGVTCAMLEFARKLDCEHFVFASTAAVYGDQRRPCRENDPPAPASPYAASKLASEHYCQMYSRLYGIPTVILRFFNVYGPGQSNQYAGAITSFLRRALRGMPPIIFGDGRQTRDFIYVDDVVSAILKSLRRNVSAGTVINIGTGKPVSVASLADRVLRILKMQYLRPIHSSPRPGDIRRSQADISLARRKLDFRPRQNLDSGLRTTIEWLRQTN